MFTDKLNSLFIKFLDSFSFLNWERRKFICILFFKYVVYPKFGSRGFRYCRIANEPVAFPVTGFVRSET